MVGLSLPVTNCYHVNCTLEICSYTVTSENSRESAVVDIVNLTFCKMHRPLCHRSVLFPKRSSRDLVPHVPTRMVRYNKLERQLRDNWAGIPVASWSHS